MPPHMPETLLSERVYEQLRALLDTQTYGPNTRLPGEIALAERCGVSRPVLRQALTRLRAEGRIHTRKGSGNYVSEHADTPAAVTFGALTSIPDIRSFLEFRCSVEGDIAALAAVHHTPETLAEIRRRRARFEHAVHHGEPGIDDDIAFHTAIAHASGNRFFVMTMEALTAQTRFSINLVRGLSTPDHSAERLARVCGEHDAIEAAISARNATVARAAMAAHLRGGIARLFDH